VITVAVTVVSVALDSRSQKSAGTPRQAPEPSADEQPSSPPIAFKDLPKEQDLPQEQPLPQFEAERSKSIDQQPESKPLANVSAFAPPIRRQPAAEFASSNRIPAEPRPASFRSPVIDTDYINKPNLAGRLRILDVRPKDKFISRHIPGAVHVDISAYAKAFTASQPSTTWEALIGTLGIDVNSPVVVCDDGSGKDAACLWAILRYCGVKDVRVLNGGWPAWLFAGAYQDDAESQVPARSLKLKLNSKRVLSKDQFVQLLQAGREQIIDGCYSGAAPNGATASVKGLGWTKVIDGRQQRFLSAADLGRLFQSAGIDPAQPTVVYGDSLEQAATLAFALETAGAKNVRIYFRGWDE